MDEKVKVSSRKIEVALSIEVDTTWEIRPHNRKSWCPFKSLLLVCVYNEKQHLGIWTERLKFLFKELNLTYQ